MCRLYALRFPFYRAYLPAFTLRVTFMPHYDSVPLPHTLPHLGYGYARSLFTFTDSRSTRCAVGCAVCCVLVMPLRTFSSRLLPHYADSLLPCYTDYRPFYAFCAAFTPVACPRYRTSSVTCRYVPVYSFGCCIGCGLLRVLRSTRLPVHLLRFVVHCRLRLPLYCLPTFCGWLPALPTRFTPVTTASRYCSFTVTVHLVGFPLPPTAHTRFRTTFVLDCYPVTVTGLVLPSPARTFTVYFIRATPPSLCCRLGYALPVWLWLPVTYHTLRLCVPAVPFVHAFVTHITTHVYVPGSVTLYGLFTCTYLYGSPDSFYIARGSVATFGLRVYRARTTHVLHLHVRRFVGYTRGYCCRCVPRCCRITRQHTVIAAVALPHTLRTAHTFSGYTHSSL